MEKKLCWTEKYMPWSVVLGIVAAEFGLSVEKVTQPEPHGQKRRARDCIEARQMTWMVLAHQYHWSQTRLGRMFKKDESTVRHGTRYMRRQIASSWRLARVYERVLRRVNLYAFASSPSLLDYPYGMEPEFLSQKVSPEPDRVLFA